MKKIFASILLLSLPAAAQNHEKACENFSRVNDILQARHLKTKPIDDSLSVYVFETVIDDLDENRTLLLESEYDRLAAHKYRIDDYLKGRNCAFFSDFIDVYRNALERTNKFVEEIGKENLAYNTQDTMYYSRTRYPFHKDEAKIRAYLKKRITYEILEDIAKMGKNKDSLVARLATIGPASKQKVVEAYLCRTNGHLTPPEGFENSMYNRFFSTFCSYFDPHSTYFNYSEKASFVSSISTENYSLGLYVSQNDKEQIIVEEIVPGGPAYKTKKIDKGDQLLKLAANNTEYPVSCASMETITDIVFSDSYRIVELTLRKNDGTIYSVNLEKKVMKADDHSVYSFILGNENPIGYIKIPSFYTAFDNNSVKGCADDVAKELTKLKKDNIKGLIIDLQFNGGGSMDEVSRLAGMFVEFGPLSVIVDKNDSRNVLKDYNRGTLYNGPMVVLVNGFSASASEFFAGVMQDYNRALIVGNTTLGKATMQTILPLYEENPQDFVKVTIDKFYRVTGQSSQYTGIVPDVELPVFFDKFMPRESSMPTAIKNDSINVKLRFKRLPDEGLKRAAAMSRQRIVANETFRQVQSVNQKVEDIYIKDKAPLQLTFDNVFEEVHSMDGIWNEINAATQREYDIKVANNSYSGELIANDDFLKSVNDFRIKTLKTDPYICESLNILNDLTGLTAD